jgi:3-methyladenine DNA glycosylase AlkD
LRSRNAKRKREVVRVMGVQKIIVPHSVAGDICRQLTALPDRKTPTVRALRREFSRRLVKAAPDEILDIAYLLLAEGNSPCRFVAYELVCHHRAALGCLGSKELEQLGRGLASWDAVDTFACYLAGPAWRERQVTDSFIARWSRSPDRWRRRAALVATVPLNNKTRGGRGDPVRTLAVCRLLTDDADDMVVKALSWALRELAKRDPEAVQAFLGTHEEVLAARVKREVGNKLRTGLKNPREFGIDL